MLNTTDLCLSLYASSLVDGIPNNKQKSMKSEEQARELFEELWEAGAVRRVT
jgi:hypothetical protein